MRLSDFIKPNSKKERDGGPNKGSRRVLRIAGRVVLGLLVIALVAVNVALLVMGDTIESFISSEKVDITEDEKYALLDVGMNLCQEIESEGLVLAQNNNNVLPLSSDTTKVNVFGWSATEWVVSGSGSGQISGTYTDFLDSLYVSGYEYNDELVDMYRSFCGERPYCKKSGNVLGSQAAGALNTHSYEFSRLYEPSIYDRNYYSTELLDNAKEFSDTAIVVISRITGESNDCPQVQYKVTQSNGAVETDTTRTYLELSSEEEALLRYVGANYDNVVVLVNSTNTMELGQIETIPGIDACMIVGTTGEYGAQGVVDALWGKVNPSGRLTDTYAYDLRTAASWANSGEMGEGVYTNSAGLYPADGTNNPNVGVTEKYDAARFIDYVEGIYVGYRWYETADAEGFWNGVSNVHGTGYQGVVQYPFGYGLSYTTFSWEVVDQNLEENERVYRDSTFTQTVRVTNTGSVAGKEVVQMYCTTPYTPGGIEKASTVLVAYAKTGLLAPGESEDVVLSFTLDDVASYDYSDANGNGFIGYELEQGTYTVELKHDAHTVAAIDGAQTNLRVMYHDILCDTDLTTGATVRNRFTGEQASDGVSIDGSDSGANIQYMTRADFAGTFPRKSDADREMSESIAALNLYGKDQVDEDARLYQGLYEDDELEVPARTKSLVSKLSEYGQITDFGRQLGLDYTDTAWDQVINSLSLSDMENLVLHGYLATSSIDAIGKPRTKEVDGPAQVGSFNQLSYGVGYPNPTVLAQTFNDNLALEYGKQVGQECAAIGVDGWYAPSVNIHRTALGGRNYEYFSEDGLLSGNMGANVVMGSNVAGTYCYMKHLACNNQDTYRDSLYTWLTEQALREIYLRPFAIAVKKGEATGMMTAYNRLGATWAGGSKALLLGVLREEWGFEGSVITDYCDHQKYMNADQQLRAGGSLYMDGIFRNGSFEYSFTKSELEKAIAAGGEQRGAAVSYLTNLRRASKDVLYTWLHARASNIVYNEVATQMGFEPINRPIKSSGRSVSTIVHAVDAAAALILVAWVAYRVRRKRRGGPSAKTKG